MKGPIYLVCISCTEEPYESLRGQLELLYGQVAVFSHILCVLFVSIWYFNVTCALWNSVCRWSLFWQSLWTDALKRMQSLIWHLCLVEQMLFFHLSSIPSVGLFFSSLLLSNLENLLQYFICVHYVLSLIWWLLACCNFLEWMWTVDLMFVYYVLEASVFSRAWQQSFLRISFNFTFLRLLYSWRLLIALHAAFRQR